MTSGCGLWRRADIGRLLTATFKAGKGEVLADVDFANVEVLNQQLLYRPTVSAHKHGNIARSPEDIQR